MSAERIVTAAVRSGGRVFTGISHKVAVHAASRVQRRSTTTIFRALAPEDYGFVTTRERFVGRAEAWTIAVARGQVDPARAAARGRRELYSEDLV